MRDGKDSAYRDQLPATQLVLLPISTWAAIHFLADAVQHPLIRAEGLFLAPWAAAVVAVLLGLAPRPRVEAPVVAVLAATSVWGVHAHSTPAVAIGTLLVAGLAISCARRLARGGWELDPPALCAAAIGLQILLHPEQFLRGQELGTSLLDLIILPVAGALAVAGLQRVASHRGLLAALLAVVLAGGWSVSVVLWLAAAATAGHLLTHDGTVRRLPLLAWLAAAVAIGLQGSDLLALLVALTVTGPIAAASGHLRPPRGARLTAGVALLAGVGWLVFEGARRGWPGGLHEPMLLGLLLPALAWGALRRPRATLPLVAVAILGLVALPPGAALAPALPFLALALPRERPLAAAQGTWSAVVAGTALLLAGYPWLRADPVLDALALFGADAFEVSLPITLAAAVAFGLASASERTRTAALRVAPGIALALSLMAMALRIPTTGRPVAPDTVLLHGGEPIWRGDTGLVDAVRTVVVEGYLTHASGIAPGEPVGRVALEADGREMWGWTLRAGENIGEWAARRPDIASRPHFRAPPTWLAWVEPEGRYFAQRYRSLLVADEPVRATRLSIERTSTAESLELVLTHIEVRP